MAVAIEDAGFEIRDTIMWLYGSGFPKSHDISKAIDRQKGYKGRIIGKEKIDVGIQNGSMHAGRSSKIEERNIVELSKEAKQWEGWGTALKPAYEPILLARKPIPTTVADNVLTHGVGGLNIDECRVGDEDTRGKASMTAMGQNSGWNNHNNREVIAGSANGRFPANIIHDGSEEVTSDMWDNETDNDASRYYYTAKASKKDRDDGLLGFEKQTKAENLLQRKEGSDGATWNGKYETGNAYAGAGAPKRNIHPTVKPTDLMQYLIRLIAPKGATVLDIFMGSGSTGKAAMIENVERDANYHFIGIDRTEEYMPIAEARIEFGLHYLAEKPKADGVVHTDQIDLFSLL
jgi:site-specific DNA-methyltransferase (adenine-specific)